MATDANNLPPLALDVEGVSHSYGSLKALDEVSLRVPEGVFAALLGINGAGKTTLFSLITRLYDNVTGSIKVWGHDVRRKPGPALAELGVVFQSRSLDRDLSVWQNLSYHAALHGMSRSESRARAEAVVDLVRLGDKMDSRVAALSGGQARRAEIARALMHGPRLLLLDEPTVGLDVKSRLEVVELVRDLVSKEGVGVLWATHLLDEIRPADQVTVLHKGQVLADAPADEISGEGTLSDAFLALTGREAAA
ncbi:ATP-binding cassette domain-containing protein [Hwanghaeella grinnelliae]|uniref:ATP-binding cassette domain-containing protein n=1 Tax=Hwanghaeella grinnelliae TaxID=2500179 RepID=A0A3S3UQJ4_9PROT|nr:ABC transporter ATP-binding protein [Hwanghaeella grinnelliae]RVU38215.1 ATP-binding cassette domain-containing protein [Hwanghaeella grinnelliae]